MSSRLSRICRRSLFLVLPLWLLLIIDAVLLDQGTSVLPGIVHAPGVLLMLLINPTWQQLHNYASWHYLIGDFLFYYLLVATALWITELVKRRRDKHKFAGGRT